MATSLFTPPYPLRYDQDLEQLSDFLRECPLESLVKKVRNPHDQDVIEAMARINLQDNQEEEEVLTYWQQLQRIAERRQDSLIVEMDHLEAYFQERVARRGETVAIPVKVTDNTMRYRELFAQAIDALLPVFGVAEDPATFGLEEDVVEVIRMQRKRRNEQIMATNEENNTGFPALLTRRYTVYIKPSVESKSVAVREIRSEDIGRLVKVRGIVTRVSEVKPLLMVNAYSCDLCGSEVFQEISSKQFLPLTECPSMECRRNNTKGRLFMQTRASRFVRFQQLKIQELPDQVPMGHIPRTMTVHVFDALSRTCNPGDIVDIGGVFLPTPYTGFRAIKAGLLADTFLEAQHVQLLKKAQPERAMELLQPSLKASSDDLYENLAKSVAPEIYGHLSVKKALLLQLVGGVVQKSRDGMRIRGDIHICLMGDPGVAKSQMLKFVAKLVPRGVYTTGKGSSGVGLTAALTKDPVTEEMVLEGGALVLADHGICCIDEFDKMDDSDRAAIHEAMEQQTISISKAGITTSLNARASILAAANPAFGRYHPGKSPTENINLPAALLSRFDVLFLMLDRPSRELDLQLAEHVTQVHRLETVAHEQSPDVLRAIIAHARRLNPTIPPEVSRHLTEAYVQLRQQEEYERMGHTRGRNVIGYATPRTLLAVARLAQARARLRFAEQVNTADVDEALSLLDAAKQSVIRPQNQGSVEKRSSSDTIYQMIRSMATPGVTELGYNEVSHRVMARGWTERELQQCITEYEEMNVWVKSGAKLVFI